MRPDRLNIQPLDPKEVGDAFVKFCARKPTSTFRPTDQIVKLITGDNILFTGVDSGSDESMRYNRTYWVPKVEYKKPDEDGVSKPTVRGFAPLARLYIVGSHFARLHIYHEQIALQKNDDELHDMLVWSYRGDYKHFAGHVSNEYGRVELSCSNTKFAENVSLYSHPLGNRDDEEFGSIQLGGTEVSGALKYIEKSRSRSNGGYSYEWKTEDGKLKAQVKYLGEVQMDADLKTEFDFEELKADLIPGGLSRDPLTEDLRPDGMWKNVDIPTVLEAKIIFTDNWGQRDLDKSLKELGLDKKTDQEDLEL